MKTFWVRWSAFLTVVNCAFAAASISHGKPSGAVISFLFALIPVTIFIIETKDLPNT